MDERTYDGTSYDELMAAYQAKVIMERRLRLDMDVLERRFEWLRHEHDQLLAAYDSLKSDYETMVSLAQLRAAGDLNA